MGPSLHLSILHANQRLLDQNNKSPCAPDLTCRFAHAKQRDQLQKYLSLWVPALICGVCKQNSDFWTRITSLYGSQTSPVVLCMQNSVLSTRTKRLYWFQPPPVVFYMQYSVISSRITPLYGSQTSPVVLCMQYSVI